MIFSSLVARSLKHCPHRMLTVQQLVRVCQVLLAESDEPRINLKGKNL